MVGFLGLMAAIVAAGCGLAGWPDPLSAALFGSGVTMAFVHIIIHAIGPA